MNDAQAWEHYDDPTKREPAAGAPRRRPGRPRAQHVPVRFPRQAIERAKELADADGVTVSSRTRGAVDEALRERDSVGRRTSR